MTETPFFEPWPEPDQHDHQEQEVDLPWMPPSHVVGVTVPLDLPVHEGTDVVVRLTRALCYGRGLELTVETWVRPGRARPVESAERIWEQQEPRFGVRLADGTRLGHRPPRGGPDDGESAEQPAVLTQTRGDGGGLRSGSSWWLHPFPAGDALDVVTLWEHAGVPESSARLELGPLREAAEREQVIWDPPPAPGADGAGWFAYAPTYGA